VHACIEATGTYGDALAAYLHEAGHTVSRVNPAAVKAYAQSRLTRTKNDRVDAALIASFCAERRLRAKHAVDAINRRHGRYTVCALLLSADRVWDMRRQKLSPRYTTRIDEVLMAKAR
jgi:transposase